MKAAVVIFPGSNCDRDMAVAFEQALGAAPAWVWHKETALPEGIDVVGLPGGFSFGDYLRCGAIAARSPIMRAVADHAGRGGMVLAVCNGWQVAIEAGLLPGALMRNTSLKFTCREVTLRTETTDSPFLSGLSIGDRLRMPVAHHDGAFIADDATLAQLNGEGRVAFRYVAGNHQAAERANPNGSVEDIAGALSANRRVLGMMPHPERAADPALGAAEGGRLFSALTQTLAA
ncbi:MAG: phosphoribosylformylglycinamidine synthase subunit PurQ [Rhodobacteraceae bacterium]|nr:phosphoribosylformylglycinamidine synthase subunit PurQ [Paracoccaceae bacterium]